ncbi:MAG TPA: AI-2E family transporter [Kofleriaceae bacterium]|nr:AI-2E family transporter [Kofleriaceae bacterium]
MRPVFSQWIVVILLVSTAIVFVPFGPWAVLAIWFGLYARRIHRPLERRLGGRPRLAAALTTSLLAVIALPIAAIVASMITDAVELVQQVIASDRTTAVFERLVQGGSPAGENQGIAGILASQGGRAWSIAQQVAGAAAHVVIGLLILVAGIYSLLVEGEGWWAWIEAHAPIPPAHLQRLGDAFRETGRGLWFGVVGAGAVQATAATIAFLALGVPHALPLGLLTLVFSVIPAIGTAIVWIPVAAGLALTGRTEAAIVMAAIGVLVISSIDNLARPWLARRGRLALPSWVVLTAMFGGIELVGGWGVLFGPLVVRLAKEALVIRATEPLVVA